MKLFQSLFEFVYLLTEYLIVRAQFLVLRAQRFILLLQKLILRFYKRNMLTQNRGGAALRNQAVNKTKDGQTHDDYAQRKEYANILYDSAEMIGNLRRVHEKMDRTLDEYSKDTKEVFHRLLRKLVRNGWMPPEGQQERFREDIEEAK